MKVTRINPDDQRRLEQAVMAHARTILNDDVDPDERQRLWDAVLDAMRPCIVRIGPDEAPS